MLGIRGLACLRELWRVVKLSSLTDPLKMKMGVVTLKTVWSILASLVSTLLFVLLVTIWCCKVWVVSVSGSSKESFDETNKHHPVLMVNSYSQELFWVHRFFFSANVWAAEPWVHLIWKSLSYASVSGTIAQSWQG